MLLDIIDDKRKLIPALVILYILSWEVANHIIFPLEASLGWEISRHASILFLPAGFIFLSFYLLRWWFIPVVLIGRTFASYETFGEHLTTSIVIENLFICAVYPLWLHLLNSAKWDVFGDEDQSNLTLIGVVIFQTMVTFTISFGSTIQKILLSDMTWDQSTQYVTHFIIGDVMGTVLVIFLFYHLLRKAVSTEKRRGRSTSPV
jgi:hypothetical protein